MVAEDAIHGADRAEVSAFIKQGGVDLGRSLIGEAGLVEEIMIPASFVGAEARDGVGRGLSVDGGAVRRARRRNKLDRAIPRAWQAARVSRGGGWVVWMASITASRRRRRPAASPTGPPLFLNGDDRFGLFKPPTELGVFAIDAGQFRRHGIFRRGCRAALARGQPFKGASVTLPSPVTQRGRIEPLPPQQSGDAAGGSHGAVGLLKYPQFFLGAEHPPFRRRGHLGRRRRWCGDRRRPPAFLGRRTSGIRRWIIFVGHDHVNFLLRPQG